MRDGKVVGFHYTLAAYVCRGRIEQPPFGTDWVTFTTIFQQRPDGCRYGVGRAIPLMPEPASDPNTPLFQYGVPTGPYLAWDFFDEELVKAARASRTGLVSAPPAVWEADTADGLAMKVLALYDHGQS